MFNVIRLDLFSGEDATVVDQSEFYAEALVGVALQAESVAGEFFELRPMINGAIAALKPYGTSQAWELRVNGERTAILAIQEEAEE